MVSKVMSEMPGLNWPGECPSYETSVQQIVGKLNRRVLEALLQLRELVPHKRVCTKEIIHTLDEDQN
jgi:hypothetical protein